MSQALTVSLCIIARDEEHFIASCINSARSLVQEIIMVDTGSTDKTGELAARMGASVFNYTWQGDFAAARNFALDRASGQWILVLDADEILDPVKPVEFKNLLENTQIQGYFVQIRSYLGGGLGTAHDHVVRLFRNRPEYRFEGSIHEQVAISIKRINQGGGIAFSHLLVHHFGYLEENIRSKNKHVRNISVIQQALAVNPDDPFLLFSLGIEYYHSEDTREGSRQMTRALRQMTGGEGYFHDALVSLGLGLLKDDQRADLQCLLDSAMSALPDDPDLHLIRGLLHMRKGQCKEAATDLLLALHKNAQVLSPGQVYSLLGDALNNQGAFGEAGDHYLMALKLNPRILYPLTRILDLKKKGKNPFAWHELSLFAPPPVKKTLQKELTRMGELPLAMIMALLSVVDATGAGEGRDLQAACREYREAAEDYRTGAGPMGSYLLICADEMILYSDASRLDLSCGFFPAAESIKALAAKCLDLLVEVACTSWISQPHPENERNDVYVQGPCCQPGAAKELYSEGIPVVPGPVGKNGAIG